MSEALLSMCVIARDEADNIERCFRRWWDHVDECVLVDTGSTDGTIEAAEAFAAQRGDAQKLVIGHFDWIDDFAAARNHADSLASGEWVSWVDLDEDTYGFDRLRAVIREASGDTQGFSCKYEATHGGVPIWFMRERVARRGRWKWAGRLHEQKMLPDSRLVAVAPEIARWVHRPDFGGGYHCDRNTRILAAWAVDEPRNAHVAYLLALHRPANTIEACGSYLALPGEPPELRARVATRLAIAMVHAGRPSEAHDIACAALGELGDEPPEGATPDDGGGPALVALQVAVAQLEAEDAQAGEALKAAWLARASGEVSAGDCESPLIGVESAA